MSDETKALSLPEGVSFAPDTLDCSLQEFVDMFLNDLKVRAISKEQYRKNLAKFVKWASMERIFSPQKEDLEAYRDHLVSIGYKPRTINNYLGIVKELFNWGSSTRKYKSITYKVKRVRVKDYWRGEKDPLSVAQVKRVLREAKKDLSEAGLRNYALLATLFCTGFRVIEAERANVGDIKNKDGAVVLYVQGKGHDEKDDFCQLHPACVNALREYISARGAKDSDPLFTIVSSRKRGERLSAYSIARIVKNAFLAVGLDSERWTAHSTRYTAINLVIDKCGGPDSKKAWASARRLARHADESSTSYYYNWRREPWTEEEVIAARNKCIETVSRIIFGE